MLVDGKIARGIVTRDLVTGEFSSASPVDAVLLCVPAGTATCSTCRPTRRTATSPPSWRAHKRGAALREPLLHPDPPDLHPGASGELPVEAHAHERERCATTAGSGSRRRPATRAAPNEIPDVRARLLPRAQVPRASATSSRATSPRATPSRSATRACGVGRDRAGSCTSTSATPSRDGRRHDRRIGTGTSSTCTSASPARTPTRSRCASTPRPTTRWVACGWTTTWMSTIPGLFVLGEANFSDHGANRLGASALMQGLADGYFVVSLRRSASHLATAAARADVGTDGTSAFARGRGPRARASRPPRRRATAAARWTPSTASSACVMLGLLSGCRPEPRRGPRESGRDRQDPRSCGGVLGGRAVLGDEGLPSTRASSRRPAASRTSWSSPSSMVRRRAPPRGVVRRALPRGVPDRGERGPARRRELFSYVAAWEYRGDGGTPSCTASRCTSKFVKPTSGATNERATPRRSEAGH